MVAAAALEDDKGICLPPVKWSQGEPVYLNLSLLTTEVVMSTRDVEPRLVMWYRSMFSWTLDGTNPCRQWDETFA